MKYRTGIAYSASIALCLTGCSPTYNVGDYKVSQKTLDRFEVDINGIGKLIDINDDKNLSEEEIRNAASALETALKTLKMVKAE